MRKTFEDMKIPLDVLHIPDIPTTTSKVSLAGIKKCSYPIEYSCAMKSHFRKFGNQMSGSGNHLCNYASLLA